MSGLSSGEGLIAQVRDPIDHSDADAPKDRPPVNWFTDWELHGHPGAETQIG